jgi:hypothetical protein
MKTLDAGSFKTHYLAVLDEVQAGEDGVGVCATTDGG